MDTNEWCISSKVAAVKSGQVGRKFRCSEKTVKQQFCSSNFVASILQVGSNFAAAKNGQVSSKFAAAKNGQVSSKFTAAKNVKLHVAASCCSEKILFRFSLAVSAIENDDECRKQNFAIQPRAQRQLIVLSQFDLAVSPI